MTARLQRSISLPQILLYGLGNILGAGIYVLVGEVVGAAGVFAPLAFLLAALVAAFSAFSYAEMAARYPFSAGVAVYVAEGLRRQKLALLVGFLMAGAGMLSAAAIAQGFAGYLQFFLPLPQALMIVGLVGLLGLLAAWGIDVSVSFAAALTVIEALGLVLIIYVGLPGLAELPEMLAQAPALADSHIVGGIVFAAFLAFFAFTGFEDMVNVAEEVRRPERNLPLGILGALVAASVLYALVGLVAVTAMPPAQLAGEEAPLAAIYTRATGGEPWLIGLISLLAMVNGALIQIIMVSRLLYGMAARGWLPGRLAYVHPERRTPLVTTVMVAVMVTGLALWLPLVELASVTSYLILTIFALVNLALLRVKRIVPRPPGIRVWPVWLPLLGLVCSLGLMLAQALLGRV